MREIFLILQEAAVFAWRGSISKASAWANVPGALFVWGLLYLLGYEVVVSDTVSGAVAVFLMCAGAAWVFIVVFKFLSWPFLEVRKLRRLSTSPLEILYDPNDLKFVRPDPRGVTWYWVGMKNSTPEYRSLYDVSLRARACDFTKEVIAPAWDDPYCVPGLRNPDPIFAEREVLHPDDAVLIQLFGVRNNLNTPDIIKALKSKHEFTLEMRARDAKTLRAVFEYDPEKSPAIRRLE